MKNYLEFIPIELKFTIINYLNEYDLLELEEIIDIDYEKLFAFHYPKDYGILKKLFKQDKYIRKYRSDWETIYKNHIIYKNYSFIFINDGHIMDMLYLNLRYRTRIFLEYPDYYKYLGILDKTFISNLHSSYLFDILRFEQFRNLLDSSTIDYHDYDNVDFENLLEGLLIDNPMGESIVLIYILMSSNKLTNFTCDDLDEIEDRLYRHFKDEMNNYEGITRNYINSIVDKMKYNL